MSGYCKDYEKWKVTPGEDATDEEILEYLDHLDACPFHAARYRKELACINHASQVVKSFTKNYGDDSIGYGERVRAYQEWKIAGGKLTSLSFRAGGEELYNIDLTPDNSRESRVEITVNPPADCIQIFNEDKKQGVETLVATKVLCGAMNIKKRESIVIGDYSICISTSRRFDGAVLLDIKCKPERVKSFTVLSGLIIMGIEALFACWGSIIQNLESAIKINTELGAFGFSRLLKISTVITSVVLSGLAFAGLIESAIYRDVTGSQTQLGMTGSGLSTNGKNAKRSTPPPEEKKPKGALTFSRGQKTGKNIIVFGNLDEPVIEKIHNLIGDRKKSGEMSSLKVKLSDSSDLIILDACRSSGNDSVNKYWLVAPVRGEAISKADMIIASSTCLSKKNEDIFLNQIGKK